MPAASLLKFHVKKKKKKNATKRCADRRNELGGSSCHAFSENLHLIRKPAKGLKALYLALFVMLVGSATDKTKILITKASHRPREDVAGLRQALLLAIWF